MIGLGYYATNTPAVIRRNVLENPAWYTAYTPYQPEISQGRLEALLNFQTMICDLTALPVANASLLDEASAAAEAMTLARRVAPRGAGPTFLADADCLPQTLDVLRTRAEPLGIELRVAPITDETDFDGVFGVLLQYPGASGEVRDLGPVIEAAHAAKATVAVAADVLALTMLKPPGELGADIAIGTTQRFGVPMGYGGPHAAYMAVREDLKRQLPGRLVGVSVDADGRQALRLALQAREQHIRREKATSNICTAQVLLAVAASMYAVYHGPDGLTAIARHAHRSAMTLAATLKSYGLLTSRGFAFDTISVQLPGPTEARAALLRAKDAGYNLCEAGGGTVQVACDETTTEEHLRDVVAALVGASRVGSGLDAADVELTEADEDVIPEPLKRTSKFLTHPVFSAHRSETAMLRYLRRLSDLDVALDRSMIPLGSCTMKLNAAAEMEAITWPEFANLHPMAPEADAAGYAELIGDLERWLCAVTGYDACSVAPNAGSAGELAGLLAIRAYHASRGDADRDVCLIPESAHGTNAASAVLAGLRVVVVKCGPDGAIALDDLRAKLAAHDGRVAGIMVTYPSTNGVYEATIVEVADLVHAGRRPGLHRRRQPQRARGPDLARADRRRRLAPEPAQDVLHPARRRRPGRRPGGRQGAPGPVPARRGRLGRHGHGGQVRLRGRAADLLGLHRDDGRRGAAGGDPDGGAVGELHRPPPRPVLPGRLHRARRAGRARVHHRPAPAAGRDHRRRRGQAADRLRLPRADDVVPGRGHVHDRADRERVAGRDRRVLRRHDRDQGRGRPGRVGRVGRGRQPAQERAAHRRDAHRAGVEPPVPADRRLLPGRGPAAPPPARSTGPRSAGSTRPTATATWSAPAPRRPRSSSG